MAQKLFFLEESLKILVISKFQRASIFWVEFETAKEPFLRCAWNVEKWNESKCKIHPVKIKETLFAKRLKLENIEYL